MTVTMYQATAGTRFVRIRELPEALQDDFMRYQRGAAMPVVNGEAGAVAFKTEWLDWLHHRRPDREAGYATTSGKGGEPHDNT